MKRFILALLFLIIFGDAPFAQSGREIRPIHILLFRQGFVMSNISGYGIGLSTKSNPEMLSEANPATLVDFAARTVGISFQAESKSEQIVNFADLDLERLYPALPQSATLISAIPGLHAGLGFHQNYSSSRNLDIVVTDINGNIDTLKSINNTYVYTAWGILAHQFSDLLNPGDYLAVGAEIGVHFLRDFQKISRAEVRAIDRALSWKLGMIYEAGNAVRVGLQYHHNAHFSGTLEYNDNNLVGPPDSNFISIQQPFVGDMPDRLGGGVYINLAPFIALSADLARVYWEDVGSELKNQSEYSGSVILNPTKTVSASVGIYRSSRRFETDLNTDDSRATFLTAGLSWSLRALQINALIGDSHLLSDSEQEHTVFRLGSNLRF